ncbi:MAG: hypothetical protein AAFW83_06720 [Pseudomonadota bacterium]
MSPLETLCQIIVQGRGVPSAFLVDNPDCAFLLNNGYLRKAGIVASFFCEECIAPHEAEVTYDDGQYGYFCPDFGFVPLSESDIEFIVPDISSLVDRLADAFRCKRRKSSPIFGETWRIGSVVTDVADITLMFHPQLNGIDDLNVLNDALRREVRSSHQVVVTAGGRFDIENGVAVPVLELAEIDLSTGGVVSISDLKTILGIPIARSGGRPNQFGRRLIGIIDSRRTAGEAFEGVNEEAMAVLSSFKLKHPSDPPPSLSSAKRYVLKVRGGS